jgi:hypothetical protein
LKCVFLSFTIFYEHNNLLKKERQRPHTQKVYKKDNHPKVSKI